MAVLIGLIVALGSAIGAALVAPSADRAVIVAFVCFNGIFAAVLYAVGCAALNFYRDVSARR